MQDLTSMQDYEKKYILRLENIIDERMAIYLGFRHSHSHIYRNWAQISLEKADEAAHFLAKKTHFHDDCVTI